MQSIFYENNFYTFDDFIIRHKYQSNYAGQIATLIDDWQTDKKFFYLTSSGSTGKIKKIKFSQHQIKTSAKQTIDFFQLHKSDTLLCCLPVNKVAGFMMVIRALEAQCNLLISNTSSNPVAEIKQPSDITFAAFVPHQFLTILAQTPNQLILLKNAKGIILGGTSVENHLIEKLQTIEIPVYATYGMTETLSHVALRKLNGNNPSSVFTALAGTNIKLSSDNCLMIKNEVTNNKWLKTNDLAQIHTKNTFILTGRADNSINTGGLKISPEIIESSIHKIIIAYFGNIQFFIGGIKNPVFGEVPALFIENITSKNTDFVKFFNQLLLVLNKKEIPWCVYQCKVFATTETMKIKRKESIALALKEGELLYERKR